MRKLVSTAPVALLALSCVLHPAPAQGETFTFTASGFDINTGITLTSSATLIGVPDPTTSGAFDLTSGGGTVTLNNGTSSQVENITLFTPSGTSTTTQYIAFTAPPFQYDSNYTYDNVIYPTGTDLNGARGAVLDEYGLLFSSTDNHFNFFGEGGYGYVDDNIVNGFNSPLSNVSITEVQTGVTPEPSSFLLLGTGVLGAAGVLRRRFVA